ncbi:PREDICTED: oxidation resistance protein 1 [Ceratosolen solmsi marchali]|uniref:Oxidation resistance protein 1 n=1 Tax=Ceratosolen solmsi marchali TaxID=326594 RepID=A0AAJ7E372_9HYME|nr:PREDICTED: oxidation resistance protein 1 [Ceratosolen solmsi marchali]
MKSHDSMESKMYISEAQSNGCGQQHHSSPKFASTNSIPSLVESCPSLFDLPDSKQQSSNNPVILRDQKARRHSVLDDLKARRDSFFQKARRSSFFEDKENKDKRRGSDGTPRRGSVFYVSQDLLSEEAIGKNAENGKDDERKNESESRENESATVAPPPLTPPPPLLPSPEFVKKGRRKSWHPLVGKPPKVDRKRRKGTATGAPTSEVGSTEGLYNARQKRPSWWNIFVPDSVNRSRRMSQDVTHTRSTENLTSSYFRSKSHSVDHGFAAPFDLDSLRNKVESRFESIDKLSRESDNESKDGSSSQEKKSGRLSQPINTIFYTVGQRDTLTSVAARFDTTPSELNKLNRLGSTFIYPGQQLRVPAKGEGAPGGEKSESTGSEGIQEHEEHDELPSVEKELLHNLKPVLAKPGHLERVKTPLGNANAMNEDIQPYKERFLKITVRHITDGQGVVGGVLLVTPNAVMFDPNVSDPLVIEHGPESYGVIAPMEFIVNAAIYYDIAHMRVGHAEIGQPDKKPEIYYMKKPAVAANGAASTAAAAATDAARKTASSGKDENFPELTVEDSESVCSCAEPEGDAFPKAFDKDLIDQTNLSTDEASTKDKDKEKNDASAKDETGGGQSSRTLEERRRSMLDHHWAVPSKDRCSFSVDDEQQDSLNSEKAESSKSNVIPEDEESSLVKQSCHDSGIDIRDPNPPLPVVQPIVAKKVYSDADIVLSSDWVPPITIAPTNVTTSTLDSESVINGRKKTGSVSFSLDSNNEEQEKEDEHKEDDKQETRKNKMLKRLSYPLSWMEGLTGESKDEDSKTPSDKISSLPNSADSHHSSVFSKVFSRRSSVGAFSRQQPLNSSGSSSIDSSRGSKTSTAPPRLDYRSMVSVDDMPELFVSFDKLIPRPARSCEDPPLYLRLRTGRPKDKKIPWSTPIMSYGKKKIRPEYWFSIPRNRVDDLYRFIHAWVPSLYGELDEEHWKELGYILSDTDTDLSPELAPRDSVEAGDTGVDEGKDGEGKSAEISELTRESWELIKAPYVKLYSILKTSSTSADSEQIQDPEVLSMSEELRRALYANSAISLDTEIIVPDLVGTTEILSDEHREQLCRHLPARAEGYLWTLVFSTSQHGFSLNSMYRKMAKIESPILLVIEDTEGNVFGALTSCSLRVSDHFYGTGESLLFRFTPRFQAFNWTGDNLYFIKGNNESLAIGAGDGKFGLWLDGDLYQGRTQSCSTYGNEPLAPHEDFVVKTLECWAFI